MDIINPQDNIPYESNALKQTHPLHLYQLAKAFDLKPTHPDNARVLELACASGGNLIPMAFYYPQSKFVGIDISAQEIAFAKESVETLALDNIQFIAQSITDYKDTQKFDYIICHGLYSWVDSTTRESVLKICQQHLSEHGIAYISYNTYPGWVVGNTLRALMLFASKDEISLNAKLSQAHELLKNLSTVHPQTSYDWLLHEEVKLVLAHSDNQLLHEHLSNMHFPLYFHEFIENAKRYDLHYLCDATFFEFEQSSFDLHYSQQQDLMNNRRFRSTLLCKQAVQSALVDEMNKAYDQLASQVNANPKVGDKPLASKLARYQITHQQHVTNVLHENILLTPIAQAIFPYLDGEHEIDILKKVVKQYIEEGALVLVDNFHNPITDKQEQEQKINVLLQETLLLLASRYLVDI